MMSKNSVEINRPFLRAAIVILLEKSSIFVSLATAKFRQFGNFSKKTLKQVVAHFSHQLLPHISRISRFARQTMIFWK